jgi:hypothetical protein
MEWTGDSLWRRIFSMDPELRGNSKVVAGDRYELRLYVPEGWKVGDWEPDADQTMQKTAHVEADGSFVRLAFVPRKTGTVAWRISFDRR